MISAERNDPASGDLHVPEAKTTLRQLHRLVAEIDRRELHLGDAHRRHGRSCERIVADLVGRAFAGERRRDGSDGEQGCKQNGRGRGNAAFRR
jgi:hypothetical protein